MSKKGADRKRKADDVAAPAAPELISLPSGSLVDLDVDAEIERTIDLVRSGSHECLMRRSEALEAEKTKQIQAADRHRQLQIINVNQLFEYEVEDAHALYRKCYAELQDQLLVELQQERLRLKNLQRMLKLASQAATDESKASSRALRSQVAPDAVEGSSLAEMARDLFPERVRAKIVPGAHPTSALDQALPDCSVRSDFMEIVRDMHAQAEAFEWSNPQPMDAKVVINLDYSQVVIGDLAFSVGDGMAVFSVLSQETFEGALEALSDHSISVRTAAGPSLTFTVAQLQAGRVRVGRCLDPLDGPYLS